VHRLLELYTHTLPAFGHVGHFQELLFETAHQPLKRGIKRSNNRDPHLSEVQALLANDWKTRLEISSIGKPNQWSDATCDRLQQLLTGVECIGSADTSRLKSLFCPLVMQKLKSVRKRLLALPTSHVVWRLEYGQHSRRASFEGTWRARSAKNQGSVAQALQCANTRSQGRVMMVFKRGLRLGRHLGVYSMYRLRHCASPSPALNICANKQFSLEASYNPS
jgi:hypothetical protein